MTGKGNGEERGGCESLRVSFLEFKFIFRVSCHAV